MTEVQVNHLPPLKCVAKILNRQISTQSLQRYTTQIIRRANQIKIPERDLMKYSRFDIESGRAWEKEVLKRLHPAASPRPHDAQKEQQ